jgi:hypothetical protein
MAVTLDASTPASVYNDTTATASLVTASFTPPSGSIVVAKVTTADSGTTVSGVTGLSFTSQANLHPGSSTTVSLWTAVGAGASITVTAAFAGAGNARGLSVEVWTGAQLAGTPAVHTIGPSSGAPIDTITTVAANSVVSWVNGDWAAIAGARTYRSSATEQGYHTLAGQWTHYSAYQAAASAGSQTYGLTAQTGQTYTMAAIEIQDAGGGGGSDPGYGYILQEDGTSRITLEDGSGFLLLDTAEAAPIPPIIALPPRR